MCKNKRSYFIEKYWKIFDNLMYPHYIESYNFVLFTDLLKFTPTIFQDAGFEKSQEMISNRLKVVEGEFEVIQEAYMNYINSLNIESNFKIKLNELSLSEEDISDFFLKLSPSLTIDILNLVLELKTLEDILRKIQMLKEAFIFELEYFFWEIADDEVRESALEEVKDFDEEINFGEITDNDTFLEDSLNYLWYFLLNFWYKIPDEDLKLLKTFYKDTFKKYNLDFSDISLIDEIEDIRSCETLSQNVPIKKVVSEFKDYIEKLWLDYRINQSENYWNFSVTWSHVNIPKWSKFKQIEEWYWMLRLMKHEIWTHAFTRNNTYNLTWKYLSLPWQIVREEWLAIFNESILFWELDIKQLPSSNYIRILFWQELEWDDFYTHLHALEKLDWATNQIDKRFERYKRYFPKDLDWVMSRDLSYNVWFDFVTEYINKLTSENSMIQYLSLYFIRVSPEDMWISTKYLESYLQVNWIELADNDEILDFLSEKWFLFESFYVDYNLYCIDNKETNEEIRIKNFIKHIKETYHFLPPEFFWIERIKKSLFIEK